MDASAHAGFEQQIATLRLQHTGYERNTMLNTVMPNVRSLNFLASLGLVREETVRRNVSYFGYVPGLDRDESSPFDDYKVEAQRDDGTWFEWARYHVHKMTQDGAMKPTRDGSFFKRPDQAGKGQRPATQAQRGSSAVERNLRLATGNTLPASGQQNEIIHRKRMPLEAFQESMALSRSRRV